MTMPTIEMDEKEMTPEQKILWNLTSLGTSMNEILSKVDKHHKVLIEGNGEIPLVEQMRNVVSFINSIKYWLKFLVGAILIQTVTFGAAAFIYFLKLYPVITQLADKTVK